MKSKKQQLKLNGQWFHHHVKWVQDVDRQIYRKVQEPTHSQILVPVWEQVMGL